MPNSGNFHSSKSNAPKIFCAWCQKWKTGHIVLKFTKGANWKIHKHSKGVKACKGSDKVVMKPNLPSSEILLNHIPSRSMISLGIIVQIVQKQDQRTGKLTEGTVKRILTSSQIHPHGIKVELDDGKIGRIQKIIQ